MRSIYVFAALLVAGFSTQSLAKKAPVVLSPVDFSSCANLVESTGAPPGANAGNAMTKFAALTFTTLDPAKGNDSWIGVSGAHLVIKLSVPAPNAVYMLMNTGYGQSGITNATIEFKGTGGAQKIVRLVGNTTVRDYNNWVWTNTINGKTAQEWWTNTLNPQPQDQSHREDAHMFDIGSAFAGQTLKQIIIKSPANAGVNYMEPLLFAIGVDAGTGAGTLPSTCSSK
jgi:hypothetical protein